MSDPREQAKYDLDNEGHSVKDAMESLDTYITYRMEAFLYMLELYTPSCDPAEGIAYWQERLRLNLERIAAEKLSP